MGTYYMIFLKSFTDEPDKVVKATNLDLVVGLGYSIFKFRSSGFSQFSTTFLTEPFI